MKFYQFVGRFGFLCLSTSLFGQAIPMDSTRVDALEEVVVTAQFEPQSLKKSVHNVTVITREQMQRQAANHLGDVLNQYLNMTVTPNAGTGRSTVSLFGLDGQYFKVMMDNIPLVSDTGLGNNVDLTQINLDDVEQIEIIEGSMGVTHGANAVSGIINIITKKNSKYDWEIAATLQEETVGKEYSLINEGRHIQSLKVSHKLNSNWFVSLGTNRNDFQGFQGGRNGAFHTQNDGTRGYLWLPKSQWVTNSMVSFTKEKFRAFYKFEFFDEQIDFYNTVVNQEFQPSVGIVRFSNDRRFLSQKFYHHLNMAGRFSEMNYNVSLSHQKQSRDFEDFKFYMASKEEQFILKETFQSQEILYSTGTLNNIFKTQRFSLQLGYETVNELGFASASSGFFRDENNQLTDLRRRLENYDFFASAEVNATENFSIRPGARYSFQSQFDNQYAVSLGLRQLFQHQWEGRFSVGKSYRTPNFEEMYTYFVDSNHFLVGNEDLMPEESFSTEFHLKKTTSTEKNHRWQNSLTASYLHVNDRISVALVRTTPRWEYEFINIDAFKMMNFATNHQWQYQNFQARMGVSLLGISQQINTGEISSDAEFLYTWQANSSLSYLHEDWRTTFSIFYKFNGKQQQWVAIRDENNDPTFTLNEINPFSWLDASVRTTFLKDQLELTIGARNLLDIVDVQSSQAGSSSGHGATNSNLLLGYGRSYFLKLVYNFKF